MCYTWWLYFCQWFSCWLTSKLNLNFGGGRRSSRQWSIQDMTGSALPLSFLYVSKNQGVQKAQPKTIILKNLRNPKWGKWWKISWHCTRILAGFTWWQCGNLDTQRRYPRLSMFLDCQLPLHISLIASMDWNL